MKKSKVFMGAWECLIVELPVYFNIIKIKPLTYSIYAVLWIVHCSFTIVSFHVCLLFCKMQSHFNLNSCAILLLYGIFYYLIIITVLSDAIVFAEYDGPMLCQFDSVTEKVIHELIVQSPAKSCMLDPIPTSLLKQCLDDLVPLVTANFSASFATSTIPRQFKQVVVIPLLKKSRLDTNNLKHFRPVSNLLFV